MIRPFDITQAYARANGIELETDENGVLSVNISYGNRAFLYQNSTWTRTAIPLAKCVILWKMGMGWRKWAKGSVPWVAKQFKRHIKDPQWMYVKNIKNGFKVLPIIVYALPDGRYEIDDGCHRAVALYLAGGKEIDAYVGVRPEVVK